ncbi:hypothetical protein LZZ85_00525 [Terrimonas sp. NA20]|uniref:Uncharacterized protein n=1 Tax=Terrimonas ginsenosidimutans TaxID=2908004 RepID=A0ABS9KKE2_9BACT|nr:hypothetical protein [Terrimonas ginsenosidimutans]MCG2612735.1 hypothetical protein [Terrimonas ginsenosidimutans]
MRTFTKIVLTIVILMVGGLIISVLNEARGRHQGGGGPLGVILSFGVIAAITAIWKWKPEAEKNDNSSGKNQQLDKS